MAMTSRSMQCLRKFSRLSYSVSIINPLLQRTPVVCQQCMKSSVYTQSREVGYSKVKNKLTSRKLEYSERKVINVPMEVMYNVVGDVQRYTDFVPYCTESDVTVRRANTAKAKIEVGFGPVKERYTSTVTYAKPSYVKSVCTDGALFNLLQCVWKFSPTNESNKCIVDFQVEFEFRSLLHSHLATMFFDEVVKTMVSAFEKRAITVHKHAIKMQKS